MGCPPCEIPKNLHHLDETHLDQWWQQGGNFHVVLNGRLFEYDKEGKSDFIDKNGNQITGIGTKEQKQEADSLANAFRTAIKKNIES
jgi:hypothetical protein